MAIGKNTQKTPRYYTVAVVFLWLVLILTGLILAYSMTVGSSNKKSSEKLESLNTSITALSNDPDIQAYQLYEQNKRQIDNMTYFSNMPLFYNEMRRISGEFGIKMSQFSYSDKKISVAASALTNPSGAAYKKYEELISWFRVSETWEEDEKFEEKMFDLEFVRSFQWENRIVSNLDFIVLEPKLEIVKTPEQERIWNENTSTGELLDSE